METRRMRKRFCGMPEERPPEWLPDGWTVEVRNTRHGKYRYYRSPVSGSTFQSKDEVLRHLSLAKHDSGTSGRASCSNESKKQPAKEIKESLEPSGWILEIKSRRRGKTVRKTNESPDSHRELGETTTIPDRLLQPSSSQGAKPHYKNETESATLNPTESDGRILAKHAEDEATEEEETKPESAIKSMEISNEEDKVTSQDENLPEKLPLISNETSKNYLEDEMKLSMAKQNTSDEKVNILDLQNKNLSEVEKELPVTVGNPSTPDLVKPKHGSRKRLPRRLSYVEADPKTDVDMGGERPHELKSKYVFKQTPQWPNDEGGASASATNMSEGGAMVMHEATMDWPDFSSASLFGDSWSDPCLEFAFKTLTGDLPVLDDAIAIQEYFQQQIFLVEGSTSADVLAPVSKNKTDTAANVDEDDKVEK
ncbi:uncharacterized protein LOC110018072 isoform X2 [Phalaenopsis equestris]|uniref:uncharacterized protein LOC110018072 isoform X2 n=1 Tax=Phalaenopsis equestris TaxID=78828 RepID=UPI0009E397E9|nr:uncharacterized protein LOC110018072 isoform X2 [Phalaenopsis equestris]